MRFCCDYICVILFALVCQDDLWKKYGSKDIYKDFAICPPLLAMIHWIFTTFVWFTFRVIGCVPSRFIDEYV